MDPMGRRAIRSIMKLVADDATALSMREREVLRLLALGHTNREIATHLHISVRTAEFHRKNIQRKLNLTSRSQLVNHALTHGLLEG
jgi:two-component system response regulator NreC